MGKYREHSLAACRIGTRSFRLIVLLKEIYGKSK